MPNDDEYDHILRIAVDIGICKPSAMGVEPIGWPDLYAWAALTEPGFEPEDYQAIIFISSAYVRYAREFNNVVVPYVPDPDCFTKEEWAMVSGAANDDFKKKMG